MESVIQAIEDDPYLTEDEDSLHIASKCWKRVMDAATKTGYREGVQDGTDSVLQNGFDIGYKDGFEAAFLLGRYKSLATVSSKSSSEDSEDITLLLDKTRRGACWICSMESENKTSNNYEDIQFSEILNNQRAHSAEIINRLHDHFEPILKKSCIRLNLTR